MVRALRRVVRSGLVVTAVRREVGWVGGSSGFAAGMVVGGGGVGFLHGCRLCSGGVVRDNGGPDESEWVALPWLGYGVRHRQGGCGVSIG